ncbi:MAG: PIN domain-containing protein [Pseudomonadota bacterium]
MGLIEDLHGQRICLDTAPIIYFIEEHETYRNIVRPVFVEIDSGNIEAITSTITLLEVLVHPLRTGNEPLAEKYREILLFSAGLITFEISHEISEMASRLRAKYSIRTPDAIQIAVGIQQGAATFLTNDPNLRKVSEIKILILDDYLPK